MSIYLLPPKVCRQIETLMRNFSWEGSNIGKLKHLIRWNLFLNNWGRRIGYWWSKTEKQAFLAKWGWRFCNEPTAFQHKVIPSLYGLLNLLSGTQLARSMDVWDVLGQHIKIMKACGCGRFDIVRGWKWWKCFFMTWYLVCKCSSQLMYPHLYRGISFSNGSVFIIGMIITSLEKLEREET